MIFKTITNNNKYIKMLFLMKIKIILFNLHKLIKKNSIKAKIEIIKYLWIILKI